MRMYEFEVLDNQGNVVSLERYAGKVLLIVNTATQCGLTPQYTALQALYEKYQDQGLEILDFPCNQFLGQAPESDAEISQFCTLQYHTTFPRFSKIDVNGANAIPLYTWLKAQAPTDKGDAQTAAFEKKVEAFTPDNEETDIKWNFGKFLVDRSGNVVARYSPAYLPEDLDRELAALL